MNKILLIPYIKIHNANALSSPYSIGFPAMSAWLGAVHALQRHLINKGYEGLKFNGMAVICHTIDLQTYKGDGDYVHSIISTGNPLDKSGKRPSFIEEARCHLTVSLVIDFEFSDAAKIGSLASSVDNLIRGKMKLAGGDVLSAAKNTEIMKIDNEADFKKLQARLMPGHCLIERRDLMQQAMDEGQDAIDALLDYLKITSSSELDAKGKVTWKAQRKQKGWLAPIATGFHGISELATAQHQRDTETPHRFAESIITLGEFVMPYRINNLNDLLWHYHTDLDNDLYLCQQHQSTNL